MLIFLCYSLLSEIQPLVMNHRTGLLLGTLLLSLIPHFTFAAEIASGSIETIAFIISIFNLALLVTALISIKQYFWPGDNSTSVFHIAHIIFVVVFYAISLPFLITNSQYYVEYADLVPLSILGKFFFSADATSLMQLVIVSSVVFNILFIRRSKLELERPLPLSSHVDKSEEKEIADNADGNDESTDQH